MTKCKWLIAVGFVWFVAACGEQSDYLNKKVIQTTATVKAPMNLGGVVVVYQPGQEHERFGQRDTFDGPRIDESGTSRFEELQNLRGDFIVEAVGGHYADPVTGRMVSMRGETLHGYTREIAPYAEMQVVITPWTELLYRFMRKQPDAAHVKAVEAALDGALGCGTHHFTRTFPAMPSEEAPLFTPGDAEMAYLQLGAWSKLAQSISREVGRGNDGVSVMRLTRAIGEVIDRVGRIDGPIEVMPGQMVASDLLRQRYAHAMRDFVEGEPKHVSLRTEAIKSFLECVSQAPANMWGPAGETLDIDGPALELEGPAVFAAPLQVRCQAQDDSAVRKINIEVMQGTAVVHPKATPADAKSGEGSPVATLFTTLDPVYLDDGEIKVTCRSEDTWGNESNKTIAMAVNKRQGKVVTKVDVFETRQDRSYVKDAVTVSCVCTDNYLIGDDACALSQASQAIAGMGKGALEKGQAVYLWDTTKVDDGNQKLVCEGRSAGLGAPIVSAPQYVWVGNFNRVTVIGEVHLDSLVEGMRVTAYAFSDGRKGKELGVAEAPNGEFELSISNEYRGPLLLEAAPVHELSKAKPSYTSLAFGEPMLVEAHHLSLLWDFYAPDQAMPQALHINAATSLAEALAVGIYRKGGGGGADKVAEASKIAHELVGKHIQPDGSLNPRETAVADLSKKHATGANSVLLGLFHVGLSRLAAEQSEEGPRYYSSLDLLGKLREDALSGVIDGREAERNDKLFLGLRYPLSSNTLRRDLASATRRWLRNDDLHGKKYAMSVLNLRAYSRPGQYLVTLSEDASGMFGGKPGAPFDEDGPELTLRVREDGGGEMDWTEMPGERKFRGAIYIDVRAQDDSDVMEFQVMFGDTLLRDDGKEGNEYGFKTPNAHGQFVVNSANYPDGDIAVLLTARDRLGNPSETPMLISIDNTPPSIQMLGQDNNTVLAGEGNVTLTGIASKELASVVATTLDGAHTGTVTIHEGEGGETGRGFDVSFRELPCNESYAVSVTAQDTVGNTSHPQTFTVICDNEPPTLRMEAADYIQKVSKEVVKVGPASPKVPLEVLVHEMDSTAAGLPTLHFVVDDQTGRKVGSFPGKLRVEVATKRSGSWMRDWEPQDITLEQRQNGFWALPISYQMLLPRTVTDSPSIAYARAHNHMALGNDNDIHSVLMRVIDEAGNRSPVTQIDFQFKMYSPAVTMSCDTTQAAKNSRVEPPTVMRFAQGKEAFFNASFDWPARSPSTTSLAPEDGQVIIVMKPTTTRWLASETVFDREITFKSDRDYPRDFPHAWPCNSPRKWTVFREKGGCSASDDRVQNLSLARHPDKGFSQRQVPTKELVTVNAFSKASVEFVGGSVPIESGVGVGNHVRPQISAHRGWELEKDPGWYQQPDRSEFVEREMVTAFILMRPPLAKPELWVQGQYPAPAGVVMDDSCKTMFGVLLRGTDEAQRLSF